MRLLVVAPRFPARDRKGDQLRAYSFIAHFSAEHELTVLTAQAPTIVERDSLRQHATVVEVHTGRRRRAFAAVAGALRGQPLEVGWYLPRALRQSARRLSAECDVVLAITSRGAAVCQAPLVVDHIDALSLNLRARSTSSEERRIVRFASGLEADAMERWERAVARRVAAQVVTTQRDAAHLPPNPAPVVIPQIRDVSVVESFDQDRDIDVIFTGNMGYAPNRLAAQRLATKIAPELRRRRPQTKVVVVGRDAARLRLADCEVLSDVPDLRPFLERSRVAIAPLAIGTGMPNKVVEAMAAGAAVVAVPWVADVIPFPMSVGSSDLELANEVLRLLENDSLRRELAQDAAAALAGVGATSAISRLQALLEAVARRS